MDDFLAIIKLFAGNFAIRGWAFCQGQIMAISSNTALFSLLGTTYGGNGQTTFALPDLRGRAPIGTGQGPGLQNYILGQVGGSENITLTINNMPAHTHTVNTSALTVTPPASTAAGTSNTPGPSLVPAALPTIGGGPSAVTVKGYASQDNTTSLAPAPVTGNITVNPSGGSQPFDIRTPYLAINYIIALEGIYPSRE